MTWLELAIGIFGGVCSAGACAQFTVDRDKRYIIMAAIFGATGLILTLDAVR